ncbi:hypothetical protein J4G37_02530 [Microvirga sp. 3-52]|nr:hypothetical protein [Microvirga sp. 3-52]
MASQAVRSAPGRSEREAGAIVDLRPEGKGAAAFDRSSRAGTRPVILTGKAPYS